MDNKQYKFKGVAIRCTYNTPDYKIYAMEVSKRDYPEIKQNKYNNVSILGELSDLTLGVEYEVTAEEQTNKYGTSYKVINLRRDMPTTVEGTYIFLSEILTDNQAQVLVEHYPDIIQKVKDNDLDDIDLSKLKGIGAKTFEKIKDKIITNFALMDLVIEFKNVLSMSIIKKIYDEYSSIDKLKEKLKVQPYTTLTRISRIGFKTADSIILQLQKENIIDFHDMEHFALNILLKKQELLICHCMKALNRSICLCRMSILPFKKEKSFCSIIFIRHPFI